MKHLKLYFLVFFITLALFACDDSSTKPKTSNNILSPCTKHILAEDFNNGISSITESTLTLPQSSKLNYLNIGDIIIVGPNNFSEKGLLLKILNKEISSEEVIITTEKAKLTEAFTNIGVDKKLQLSPEDIQEIELQNSTFSTENDKFNFQLDCLIYDQDANSATIEDQVKLTGNLAFQLALDFELEIVDNTLKEYKVSTEIDKNVDLILTTGSYCYQEINDISKEIGNIYFTPQVILVENIPFVLTPSIQISVSLKGTLMVQLNTDINYSESSESGLEYDSGFWDSISSNENEFSPSSLSDNNELDFTQKVSTSLSLDLFNSELASILVDNNLAFKTKYNNMQDNSNTVIKNITATQQIVSDLKMTIISSLLTDKHSEVLAYVEIIADDYSSMDIPDDMAYVPGGAFIMGNTRGAEVEEELTPHEVFISPFYMCIHEVTQSEYSAIMRQNPSHFIGEECPVEKVSRPKAFAYCNLLSIAENREPCYTYNQDGTDPDDWYPGWISNNHTDLFTCDFTANGYRLPTEAEWEYAARAATNEPDYIYSGSNSFSNVAAFGIWEYWWGPGGGEGYDFVGYNNVCSRNANSLGIYDMTGSVWEMCWDYYAPYNTEFQVNPTGPESGIYRISRGGSVNDISIGDQYHCEVMYRKLQPENDNPTEFYGFRVVMNADQDNRRK